MELSKRSKSLKYLAAMTGCAACLLTACGTARPDTVDLVIFEEGYCPKAHRAAQSQIRLHLFLARAMKRPCAPGRQTVWK